MKTTVLYVSLPFIQMRYPVTAHSKTAGQELLMDLIIIIIILILIIIISPRIRIE